MDKEKKVEIILNALEMIKRQKAGQYFEKIFEICASEYGWDREDTQSAIKDAKNDNVITEVSYNGKSQTGKLTKSNYISRSKTSRQ